MSDEAGPSDRPARPAQDDWSRPADALREEDTALLRVVRTWRTADSIEPRLASALTDVAVYGTFYVSIEDVVGYIAERGFEIRDLGLLDSALARPRASAFGRDAYPAVPLKAAALIHSLAQNQPLGDGNRRLALATTAVFLRLNGYRLGATDDELYDLLMAIADPAARVADIADIAARLRTTSVRDPA